MDLNNTIDSGHQVGVVESPGASEYEIKDLLSQTINKNSHNVAKHNGGWLNRVGRWVVDSG